MSTSYRHIVVAIWLLVALLASASLWLGLRQIDKDIAGIARERGAALFRLIEITREWNAHHGGVYVSVTEFTQPNPYLDHERRDLVDQYGRSLTLINPAFMTRQISALAHQANGAHFHITSRKPIRPANQPDTWEATALAAFESGAAGEMLAFFADGGGVLAGPAHRYMPPLLVKPACLACHAHQGYRVGDVRGGISVTMPAERLLASAHQRRKHLMGLHLVGFLSVAALGHMIAWRTRHHLHALEEINCRQEAVITERTRDLSASNAALAREVNEVSAAHRALEDAQARYRAVIESSQNGVAVIEDGHLTFANERLAEIVGRRPYELVGTVLLDWVMPHDRVRLAERIRLQTAGEPVASECRLRLPRGDEIRHVDLQSRCRGDEDGRMMVIASIKDVTDQLEAERERLIAAAVFDSAAEAIMVTDKDNVIVRVNSAFTAITGYTPVEVIGKTPRLLKSGRHEAAFYQEMWRHIASLGRWEGEIWNRRKNGEVYVEWLSITTIQGEAGDGRHVATFIDITRRKEVEEIILHRANYDALTDLPNRGLFEDRLISILAMARRHRCSFALMYIDLDRFKEVNDTLGHAAGDVLFTEVTKRMDRCMREADTVARLGGDEFALLLADLNDAAEAEEVARRLNATLAQPFALAEGEARVSASIGIAIYPSDGADDLQLRKAADQALYAAKAAGRNTYRLAGAVRRLT